MVGVHRFGDLIGERARVSDARRASVSDQVEARRLEILHES